jgi:hypothetical protein
LRRHDRRRHAEDEYDENQRRNRDAAQHGQWGQLWTVVPRWEQKSGWGGELASDFGERLRLIAVEGSPPAS